MLPWWLWQQKEKKWYLDSTTVTNIALKLYHRLKFHKLNRNNIDRTNSVKTW